MLSSSAANSEILNTTSPIFNTTPDNWISNRTHNNLTYPKSVDVVDIPEPSIESGLSRDNFDDESLEQDILLPSQENHPSMENTGDNNDKSRDTLQKHSIFSIGVSVIIFLMVFFFCKSFLFPKSTNSTNTNKTTMVTNSKSESLDQLLNKL